MWHWSASFPQNDSLFLQPAGNSHQPKESQSIQRVIYASEYKEHSKYFRYKVKTLRVSSGLREPLEGSEGL